jgi:hypothetical protein
MRLQKNSELYHKFKLRAQARITNRMQWGHCKRVNTHFDGFGGLVVRMLASGSRVRGLKPGRSC